MSDEKFLDYRGLFVKINFPLSENLNRLVLKLKSYVERNLYRYMFMGIVPKLYRYFKKISKTTISVFVYNYHT